MAHMSQRCPANSLQFLMIIALIGAALQEPAETKTRPIGAYCGACLWGAPRSGGRYQPP